MKSKFFSSIWMRSQLVLQGVRYLNALATVTSPRIQERHAGRFGTEIDTGLPELGLEALFGREGLSYGVMLCGAIVLLLGGYGAVGMGLATLIYFAAHLSLAGLGNTIGGLMMAAAMGGLSAWGARSSLIQLCTAGEKALSAVPAESRDLLQRALKLHRQSEVVPTTVVTWLDVARYTSKFRLDLASAERSTVSQVRALFEARHEVK